ncbi:MAG: RsmF rRNA methyltransferase first C-terminal domain-containing protein [Oscillospiraceae bacterium]|nr:RsmF rRNA methyltransferase first C-terminal domain-containing protein [Oscillospiraceae bacterium]
MQLPQEFTERMKHFLGEEYEAFLRSYDREQAQALRVNTLKITSEAFEERNPFSLRRVPWTQNGFYYQAKDRPGKHPYHEAGLYYIQEPSAMAVGELAMARPGERVLDLCAAPGGKTTHLAADMKGRGLLVSNEIHPARAKILAQNVERMGIVNAVVTNETPEKLAKRFSDFFDRIVVDAPCSGEGMFRKEPQAAEQWSLDNVRMCAERQTDILNAAASMLRPGGTLIYSTCTFAPEENEGSISSFLRAHPDFCIKEQEAYKGFLPGHPEWAGGLPETSHTFRLWPHQLEGEGHYAAVLEKRGEASQLLKEKASVKMPVVDRTVLKLYEQFVKENLTEAPEGVPVLFGEQLYLLPCPMDLKGLKVLRAGLHVGTIKKNRLEPAHALALALRPEGVKRCFCLNSEEKTAEAYLKGEALPNEGDNGWTLVLVDGHPLGWGKQTGQILKNHYPKGLRWM